MAAGLERRHNQIETVETNVGVCYQTRHARNPQEPSGNLGEIAVDEHATTLARSTGPGVVPLVLFEDPDVMEWLNVMSYDELVDIMHANGRLMPGHQPMRVPPETRALVRRTFRPTS